MWLRHQLRDRLSASRVKLATWNVNSVRQRESHIAQWLARVSPEVLFLQEIKCEAPAFPSAAFEALGYRCEVVGQKAYNGVAALCRVPFEVIHRRLPGLPDDDAQARYVEIVAGGMTLGGLYLPNGNSGGDVGYAYKLAWMAALGQHSAELLAADKQVAFLGDFNVCPTDDDFASGTLGAEDALVRPPTRAAYRSMLWQGLTDAARAIHPVGSAYTFWDYQAGAWPRDKGLRIDLALLSPNLAERLVSVVPDREERAQQQPSDHVPLVIELS